MGDVTVWYDGACPLCRREFALMRRLDRRGAITFVDVSAGQPESCPVSQEELLARFHVRENGQILSGAAGFAAMWRAIPLLKPFGHLARLPVLSSLFEMLYRLFLRIRPRLQKLVRQ
ncbi:thiol-disulfide oxidoreductase DCC family protein [Erythrobacter sp. EC-HK427]|uniref:thiol-disulfide oxidoreductase DCC family protein n=1 Tax=Erythrobacter sp. EC-HK427 TaxID=2038396 RepID=UPI0012573CBA|nr:DUF393 domain-containing protein [Erythrobacter sp. EC-HK427]VVT18849.1 Thiol-disulfide oxidoreductase [Erythrobacter sp. EC-HK427]